MPPSRNAGFRRLIAVAAAAVLVASTLAFSPPAAAQTQPFTDTSSDAYYSDAVTALADSGIFDGTECAEGMLCPHEPIDRKTMAVWTVRALDGQEPAPASGDRFTDVDPGSFHAPFIERMAELGVTSGCGDSTFCPHDTVTRAQMAVFLTRAFNLDPGPDPGFSDVAPNAWYYNQAAGLAASGITAGCGDGTTFCPNQHTTRAQMATFLARALGVIDKPTPPTAASTYIDVAIVGSSLARSAFGCGLLAEGTVNCWGLVWDYDEGTYGLFVLSPEAHRGGPQGTYKTITGGDGYPLDGSHLCAIGTDDTITCWNIHDYEQADTPQGTYKTIAGGGSNWCAIGTDGTITCWLYESYDIDGTITYTIKYRGAPQGTYKTITSGGSNWCAIGTDDTATCWYYGLVHNGGTKTYPIIYRDAPQGTYKTIASGGSDWCAIGTDDTATCWYYVYDIDGRRTYTIASRDAPQGTYKTIASDGSDWCVIGTDDTITCWGENYETITYTIASRDAPQGTYKTIAGGLSHWCAIGTDGTITCWGEPRSGDCCGGAAPRGW